MTIEKYERPTVTVISMEPNEKIMVDPYASQGYGDVREEEILGQE